ncbi:sigma factor-binding protein Crl [Vibrio tapetis subsp. quintayensis]|uniref:sigma factor-binding protein Crl n=1 Tax=Vibrio tapetis TaxID=52443 RepID=UPI0025B61912|nr:sigma factor-binding protein Crl [Vibrio tapetis]MDN3680050.1 sigma factor-binding protein Crl [Vibrio tapetis subsp. quintayensis]
MSDVTASPTHYRLLSTLKAIGPYLREPLSEDGHYLFDCLSVCVSDKKSPEEREFWGWWMELDKQEPNFVATYHLGLYNEEGNWVDKKIPAKALPEVQRTLDSFDEKLRLELQKKFELTHELHPDSVKITE